LDVRIGVIIPTLNAGDDWPKMISPLLQSVSPQDVLIIDSSSTDGTVALANSAGFQVCSVARKDFNHGATRQFGATMLPHADILVYLTQDAVLHDASAVEHLLAAFLDPDVAAAYGRQLPRPQAEPIEAHARLFNYPDQSQVKSLESRERLGLKTIFISNSFAGYRRSMLMEAGGFPADVIFGEDTVTAGKLLLKGWKIAYVAEAKVYHSHSYSWRQEFRRYFDIGVLHSRESWLLEEYGRASSEGKRFVLSELKYLWPRHAALIPSAIARTFIKLTGYKLGRLEKRLNRPLRRSFSMHPAFWK
jgi:rhamnosyltransferase